MSSEDFEGIAQASKEQKERKIKKFYDTDLPKIELWVSKYTNLTLIRMKGQGHFRIKNTEGKFVDVWHTRAMRRLDGGHCGMGYKDRNLYIEMKKLV